MLEATILVLVFGGLGYLVLNLASTKHPSQDGSPSSPGSILPTSSVNVAPATATGMAALPAAPGELAARAASPGPEPATNPLPVLAPLTVLDNARVVMHNYSSAFGENPVGNNAEITAALMGNNPKQVVFITVESGLRVNGRGELVDGFGTPFFFHQLSGKEMEIRSAGEDRQMWTFDDKLTR